MSFCREKQFSISLETCSAVELDDCLKKFYFGLRTKDGAVYQRSSYVAARSAIQRQLTIFKRPFNIRSGDAFQNSNRVLDAVLKKNKAQGKARPVRHKEAISAADKERLEAYFEDVLTSDDTYKLQSFVWYCFARHFGLRGGEVFAKITPNDLQFCNDEDSSEFVKLKTDFLTKNTPGGLQAREFNSCGRIQEQKQVKSLKKLLTLLHPSQTRLFQRVLPGCRQKDGPWFANAPLGKNSLADMMPLLSVRAKLATRYTNHCVRASVVTDLKEAGFSNHEVCSVTGHKSELSVQSYDRLDRAGSKRPSVMSSVLDGAPLAKTSCKPHLTPVAEAPAEATIFQNTSAAAGVSFPFGAISLQGNAVIHNLTINLAGTGAIQSDKKELQQNILPQS